MTEDGWLDPTRSTLGAFLAGDAIRGADAVGERRQDTSYLLWLHAGGEPVDVVLPPGLAERYTLVLRTDGDLDAIDQTFDEAATDPAGTTLTLLDRTFALYEAH